MSTPVKVLTTQPNTIYKGKRYLKGSEIVVSAEEADRLVALEVAVREQPPAPANPPAEENPPSS
jgi:hypothetical protein